MKLVTIPEERFLELIDAERSAKSCKSCGPLAQRDRLIAALEKEKDSLVGENYALHHRIEHDLSGGNHELKRKSDELKKKYDLAVKCICEIENVYGSNPAQNDNAAMRIIRSYRERVYANAAGGQP